MAYKELEVKLSALNFKRSRGFDCASPVKDEVSIAIDGDIRARGANSREHDAVICPFHQANEKARISARK